jgi:hypothetical protein
MPITGVTEDKIARLPKWAQRHIKVLEEKIKRQTSLLQEEEKTRIRADMYMSDCYRYIPERSSVRYLISKSMWVDVRLKERREAGAVVELNSSDQMLIVPESTNHVYVTPARRVKVVLE